MTEVETTPRHLQAVAEDRHAITYMSLGEAERKEKTGLGMKTARARRRAGQPCQCPHRRLSLSRPLILVTRELPGGEAKSFRRVRDFIPVTDLIQALDFVPYLD
jgi:hypothetical protein